MSCWLAGLSAKPCDGPLDRAHLIPKQRIKKALRTREQPIVPKAIVWDSRTWRFCCRQHHSDFDNKALRVPRASLPAGTEAFAREHGLGWSLDLDYGPKEGS